MVEEQAKESLNYKTTDTEKYRPKKHWWKKTGFLLASSPLSAIYVSRIHTYACMRIQLHTTIWQVIKKQIKQINLSYKRILGQRIWLPFRKELIILSISQSHRICYLHKESLWICSDDVFLGSFISECEDNDLSMFWNNVTFK